MLQTLGHFFAKLLSLSNPLWLNCLRNDSSVRSRRIAFARPSTSRGSTMIAASPTTSGRDAALEQTTGVPHAIASRGGRPKPS